MMSNFTLRTTFYSLSLALAFCNQGFGLFLGITVDLSPHQWIFSIILASVCFLTWIWSSVLLAYNNRPTSTHALTSARAHFYSFLPLVPIFFAVGIMILSQIHFNCHTKEFSDGEADGWCGAGATAGSLSIIQSIVATLAIWSILRSVSRSHTGLKTNIAAGDSNDTKVVALASQA
ncbi:hypothetical protein BDN70DRAFT_928089 [Pholiota conissans]|uniref:Uncharacterized protein n=1 Tax=Pholiota conissans TaxID=109636 RepID=A0A9P5ZE92_9AGAR|nr:hypothetical protein BDN70DRAFT_928089 [Pholiota conissans]